MRKHAEHPSWDRLYEIASAQDGYFSLEQAADAGYSSQLLHTYLREARVTRALRAVYRLVHFPPTENEDLTMLWVWSKHEGVFSHQTALALHLLSDVLPAEVHMTLPRDWRRRRTPKGVVVHLDAVPEVDQTWHGAVRLTSVRRTLNDCADESLAPDLLRQAALQALSRGLVTRPELGHVDKALQPYGGLTA
ncbi:MAG TPA: hypothetical protein PKW35_21630 [Nannocystaceae bacterium]|nr:hypothetical protein [Nannocystaceae bacterium]